MKVPAEPTPLDLPSQTSTMRGNSVGAMDLGAIARLAFGHFLTDLCQGSVPALLPFLVAERGFSYTAAASLVFAISASSSVVQPLFGLAADRLAMGWLLPVSVLLTGAGVAIGAQASTFPLALLAFAASGLGVAAFHPEAARRAHEASGNRRATGMSYFTVGGVVGFALAPVLTTIAAVGWGMPGMLYLLVPTLVFAASLTGLHPRRSPLASAVSPSRPSEQVDDWGGFLVLSGVTICRSVAFFGLNTFLALDFMRRWGEGAAVANRSLAVFLGTSIAGTLLGGWLADRLGRRWVLRGAFAGAFVVLLAYDQTRHPNLALLLLVPLGMLLFLPSSVQVVLGQEYLPGRVGTASGVTFGLAVSVGGMAAPLLGRLADAHGTGSVIRALECVLILATLLASMLPPLGSARR